MNIIKLPFELNVPIKTYQFLSFPLGIVYGNVDQNKILPWLCNKYINCYYVIDDVGDITLDIEEADRYLTNDHIINRVRFHCSSTWTEVYGIQETEFIEFAKKHIVKGYYISGYFNEKYISAKAPYMKYDFYHDYLIYGFDDNNDCFLSVGYTSTGRYESFNIPYSEYFRSIFNSSFEIYTLDLLQFNVNYEFKIDLNLVKNLLLDYIQSTTTHTELQSYKVYGVEACKSLIRNFQKATTIDLRATRVFWEHKKVMFDRLQLLSQIKVIDDKIVKQYENIKTTAEKVYLASIKYNMTKNNSINDRCIGCIKDIIEQEKLLLTEVIDSINSFICTQKIV